MRRGHGELRQQHIHQPRGDDAADFADVHYFGDATSICRFIADDVGFWRGVLMQLGNANECRSYLGKRPQPARFHVLMMLPLRSGTCPLSMGTMS